MMDSGVSNDVVDLDRRQETSNQARGFIFVKLSISLSFARAICDREEKCNGAKIVLWIFPLKYKVANLLLFHFVST